jgi:predicted nucleotidyltransferase
MNIFLEEHRNLITELLEDDVDFILIGGYAVNYHGYNRTTGDLDVWIKPDNGDNKRKLLNWLVKYGIEEESLNAIGQLDFTQPLVFSIGEEPYKTDFLTRVSGVTYDEADSEKIMHSHEGVLIPFINLNHLILTKMSTGRGKDKVDVEMLQKVVQAGKMNKNR